MKKIGKLYEQDHFLADMVAEVKTISGPVEIIVDDRELLAYLKNVFPLLLLVSIQERKISSLFIIWMVNWKKP